MLRTVRQTKANWIGYSLCRRNFLLKHIIEGEIEAKEDVEEDVCSYWMTLRENEETGI